MTPMDIPFGDEALIHLVGIIKDAVRMQDLYGRYGGEEFTILLAETSSDEAFQIKKRVSPEDCRPVNNEQSNYKAHNQHWRGNSCRS